MQRKKKMQAPGDKKSGAPKQKEGGEKILS